MIKSLLRAGLDHIGLEVRRNNSLNAFLNSRKIDLVLDVGANEGQFGSMIRRHGYREQIISFEPMSGAYAKLAKRASGDPKWETKHLALGNSTGNLELHVSELSVFNSFLPATPLARQFDPRSAVVSTENVEVDILDRYHDTIQRRKTFLKIDTQGFEQQVLAGGLKVLGQFLGIQLELPISHLYEHVWSLEEAISKMKEYGFQLAQIRPVNVLKDDKACLMEIDCVFRRT